MCSSMKASRRACMSLTLGVYSKSMVFSPWLVIDLDGSSVFLGELPGQFSHRAGAGTRGARLFAGRRTVFHPLGNALQNGGDAEHVVGQVEVPVPGQRLGRGEAGALAVAADVVLLGRAAQ